MRRGRYYGLNKNNHQGINWDGPKYIHQGPYVEPAKTIPIASENRCKLYPPERKLTKAILTSLNLEGEDQGEI